MNRQDVERIITSYLKPIFGFALKKCRNVQDAEDLSQEILARAFRALLIREDIRDMGKFIWTVAHNTLSNYYRDAAKSMVGISIEEAAEWLEAPSAEENEIEQTEILRRLQSEIAYLSKMQRRIVIAYYFENRKQTEIAQQLGIPLGTVKWHLFEAKKELKRGMDTMRKASELKFHPIQFHSYGITGSMGTKSLDEFFRSALSQNICYCVRNTKKTVNEIAEDLGVSPVYVENEAEFLEQYGFLRMEKDKYIANFIIEEMSTELLNLQNEMYKQAAELFANDVYEELISSGILEDPDIRCGQAGCLSAPIRPSRRDYNFLLWTLIPYIAARSGEKQRENGISWEEVATVRPDGAHNIFRASVLSNDAKPPEEYTHMEHWYGPIWRNDGKRILWKIDSDWSGREVPRDFRYEEEARQILSLYEKEQTEPLTKEEYAWLAERGCVKINEGRDGSFHAVWPILVLATKEVQDRLLAIGDHARERHRDEFVALLASYAERVMQSVPTHLKNVKEYELQSVFQSDGWFLLHCLLVLLHNGKLEEPNPSQRKSLMTVVTHE